MSIAWSKNVSPRFGGMVSAARQNAKPSRCPQRIPGLDFVRACAAFMIVLIHAAGGGFYEFGSHWGIITTARSAAQVAIPLFFMTTGAILVPRDEPVSRQFRRALRLGFPLLAWSCFYAWRYGLPDGWTSWWGVLESPAHYHLWFFYSIIPAYLFLPTMQALYRHKRQAVALFLGAWFALSILLPALRALADGKLLGLDAGYFPVFSGYFLLGAFLGGMRLTVKNFLLAGSVWMGTSIAIAFATRWHSISLGLPSTLFFDRTSPWIAVSACAAFLFIKRAGEWIENHSAASRTVRLLASASLGIYLFHVFFLHEFYRGTFGFSLNWDTWHPAAGSLATALAAYLASAGMALALMRIPIIRRTVPGAAGL